MTGEAETASSRAQGRQYRERLTMSPWWALVVVLFALSVGVAVLAWLPSPAGMGITALILALVTWAVMAAGSIRVSADAEGLRVGRSAIEWQYLDRVRGCDAATMAAVLHSPHQIGSFLVTRPWISTGVVVRLADPADPHPAWIVSTRHPGQLAEVIRRHISDQTDSADSSVTRPATTSQEER
ncbi:DUF3093 domain-containing protein [Acidipropionibacterium thoenii]|uniref:DUF3093 domain-containing protein n=1 Tax=Acidipropionibacterium thoenii TaxID=1751 RepID=UPI000683F98C|nr:DUF3093 domain-containing protein [Acidipropionibacterium thoenii]